MIKCPVSCHAVLSKSSNAKLYRQEKPAMCFSRSLLFANALPQSGQSRTFFASVFLFVFAFMDFAQLFSRIYFQQLTLPLPLFQTVKTLQNDNAIIRLDTLEVLPCRNQKGFRLTFSLL